MARRSGRKTDFSWFHFGDVETAEDISTVTSQFGTAFLQASQAQTVTRMRGKVGVVLDTAAVDESAIILCGLFITGPDVTNPPELLTGTGADEDSWIWQGQLYVNSGAEAAINTNFLSDSIEVDTKAMRRMKAGQRVAFVFQTPNELSVDQGGTYDLSWYIHVLVGL